MQNKTRLKSLIGGGLLILAVLLTLNAAYLAAFTTPDMFYVVNMLLHLGLGIAAIVLLVIFLVRNSAFFRGSLGMALGGSTLIAVALGVYLAFFGMTRPHSIELYCHVSFSVLALLLLVVKIRPRRQGNAAESSVFVPAHIWKWSFSLFIIAGVFYVGVVAYHHFDPNPNHFIRNPSTAPLSMDQEGGGKNSLVFPSSAQTADGKTIPSSFFEDSKACERCHADIYHQWYSSMHHYSSFNNQWYRKAIEYMQDTVGIKSSLWCGGCHDHALVFSDVMQTHPIREIEETPGGQAGLGCMSCHAIVHVGSTMGNGGFVIEHPALTKYAVSKNPAMRMLHDYLVRLDPKPHRAVFLKPFHRQPNEVPSFCSACHKVHLDVPVNHYRWIRGFDEYDNWQASGVSGQGARSFYYPPHPQECVNCHMPLVKSNDFGNIHGFVHSHRFAAANTAVPTSQGDEAQVKAVESFLKGALRVDIFALAQEPPNGPTKAEMAGPASGAPQLSTTFAVGEESSRGFSAAETAVVPPAQLIAPLGDVSASLKRGQDVRVEVVVRTLRLGHFFPGGTVDAFDCWLELKARDNKGHIIFWSGAVADNGKGPVDPSAHFYRSLQLDGQGNVVNKRNSWSTHAVMYTRLIAPGAADTVHYRLKIPKDCGDQITFTAKLNYRKFDWWITQWAFAGVRNPADPHPAVTKNYDDGTWVFTGDTSKDSESIKGIPNVPIVVIAQDQVTVPVANDDHQGFEQDINYDAKAWDRWNDYGIGLLLQGDLKGAERAFRVVTRLNPGYADGWVNIARALVQEGNTDAAKPILQKAFDNNPKLASAHYYEGLVLKADGDYPAAYQQFAAAAAEYPNDRVVRDQMGRMLFLQRKYSAAVQQLDKTLSIDPEDLDAHYNLMLCYRGLNKEDLADRETKLYLRFKAYEAARAITGSFKLSHPWDNNEAQPIHEHNSIDPKYLSHGDYLPPDMTQEMHAYATSQASVPHRSLKRRQHLAALSFHRADARAPENAASQSPPYGGHR
ncbi:MAG: tetratricopeptide repeat protein [Terriglobia bacterium]